VRLKRTETARPSHMQSLGSYPQHRIVPRQPRRRGACSRPWGGARRPWTYAS
jgi:hypothetical protein